MNLGLTVIKLSRKLFRNTPVHNWKITNILYRVIFNNSVDSKSIVEFKGLKLKVDPNDITIVPTLHTGQYEEAELKIFESLIKPGDLVLDIGANIGIYSLFASKKVGDKGKVIAVEAVPENVEILRQNIEQNSANNVTVLAKAASDKNGEIIKIYMQKGSMGTHSAVKSGDNFVQVETVSIDTLFKEYGNFSTVKIDVEGYEAFVLMGGINSLKKTMPNIFIEYDKMLADKAEVRVEDYLNDLKKLYKFTYVVVEKNKKLESFKAFEDLPRNSNVLFTNSNV